MGEVFETIGAIALFAGMMYFFHKTSKKEDIKRKKEKNVLSTLSISKTRSLSSIASSCGVEHAELVEILEALIERANFLSANKKSDEHSEKHRFLRNARIDYKKDEIILDENATEIITRLDTITNAINVLRGNQPMQSQPETPKDWHCTFCDYVNKGTRDKCLNCGAPSN